MDYSWKDRIVTITGGAGCLGSCLAQRLVNEGAKVRVLDNLERGRLSYLASIRDQVDFRELDLRDAEAALTGLEGSDVVFHLASKVGGIKVYLDQPGTILCNNLLIDQHVFKAVVELKIPSVFYASSAHIYPDDRQQTPDAAPLTEDEDYPANPGLTYGWGKLMGEKALMGLAQEHDWLRVSIARIVGAYGYNQDIGLETGSVIPVFCHRAIRWPNLKPFRIWGTGTETRSYCFVDDVIEGFLRSVAAQQEHNIVGPFNLGSEGRVTIRDIAETVVEVSGKDIELSFDPTMKTALWGQAVICDRARKLLYGWEPQIDLKEGLRRSYQHIQERLERGETC